ncbi:MAG: glycosyltransferase family 1 protein [Sporolactobacillus sp.]
MKIAIFTDTYTPQVNGVAKTLERLTQFLNRHGIEFLVFTPQHIGEKPQRRHIETIRSIPLAIYPECRLAVPGPIFIKEKMRRFRPDLIHVATPFNMGLVGKYYAKKMNLPLVGSYHTDFDAYLNYYKMDVFAPLLWNYLRWFHHSLLKTFVPSQETLIQLKQKGFHRLGIWSRGVDCEQFRPCGSRALRERYGIRAPHVLCFAGRLAPEKAIDTLLATVARVNAARADVHWIIAGDGPSAEEMKKAAPANVTFTGYLSAAELAELYSAADAMVFPSPTETFGNVVLESMACATPVVGAASGGVKNIISDGSTGVLCPPRDAAAFAAATLALLADSQRRSAMARAARHYALLQSWECIFDRLLGDYQAALALWQWMRRRGQQTKKRAV